jgi:glycosyltransferase involved in cell wall biosynthesis
MIQSARVDCYPGLEYEFVIVDGGSTDGTLEWCRNQPDIRLIEHGELRGAIPAFCDGARNAQGDYVVMANDDIEFHPNSLLAAIAHLQENPNCGAVAFADNRVNNTYGVQAHPTRNAGGTRGHSFYAQVGMFRRWLGELAGWWGDRDELMSGARTYGGDNFLSARIWEMGYTIDSVRGCRVHDVIFRDAMRKVNGESGVVDSGLFYKRFPNGGPKFGSQPVNAPEHQRGLRILYLPIFEDNHAKQRAQKRGLRDALGKLGTIIEYDYVTKFKRGIDTHEEITAIARGFRPHILFTQVHRVDTFSIQTIQQLRADNPRMICLNWNGDVWDHVLLEPEYMELLRWYDLQLIVNGSILPVYERNGIAAAYWQAASEEPRELPEMPTCDVLYLANCYSDDRREFGKAIKELPYDTALWGSGWDFEGAGGEGVTLYDFASSHALMKNATIVLGDNQFPKAAGFVSNRFFEALGAGAFVLHHPILDFEQYTGFVAGKHYATFEDNADLAEQVEYWMTHDKEREKIRRAGVRHYKKYHTFDARVRDLFTRLIPEKVRIRERV